MSGTEGFSDYALVCKSSNQSYDSGGPMQGTMNMTWVPKDNRVLYVVDESEDLKDWGQMRRIGRG